jgi:hypothetical protein
MSSLPTLLIFSPMLPLSLFSSIPFYVLGPIPLIALLSSIPFVPILIP